MNKTQTILLGVLLATGFLVSTSAAASFAGYYDPGDKDNNFLNWILTNTREGSLPATTGGVDTTKAPYSILITGQDDNRGDPDKTCPQVPGFPGVTACSGLTVFTIPAETDSPVPWSFKYVYSTDDISGNPNRDPFGYVLNGVYAAVVDGTEDPKSGKLEFSVMAGWEIGWQISTVDNFGGSASVRISDFSAPESSTPTPGTLALLGFGLMVPALRRRRR